MAPREVMAGKLRVFLCHVEKIYTWTLREMGYVPGCPGVSQKHPPPTLTDPSALSRTEETPKEEAGTPAYCWKNRPS